MSRTGELGAILDQETACVEALLRCLSDEREAIRTLSAHGMTAVAPAKLRLVEELRSYEAKRTAAVGRLAAEWAVEPGALTLHAIADRVGAQERGVLLRQSDRLTKAIGAVREANALNGSLIARTLALLREEFLLWRGAPVAPTLYSAAGAPRTMASGDAVVEQRG